MRVFKEGGRNQKTACPVDRRGAFKKEGTLEEMDRTFGKSDGTADSIDGASERDGTHIEKMGGVLS